MNMSLRFSELLKVKQLESELRLAQTVFLLLYSDVNYKVLQNHYFSILLVFLEIFLDRP